MVILAELHVQSTVALGQSAGAICSALVQNELTVACAPQCGAEEVHANG